MPRSLVSHNIAQPVKAPRNLLFRSYLHSVRNFFLYHNSNRINRNLILKQSHDNRGSNVIWQIGNNLDRTPLIFSSASWRMSTLRMSLLMTVTLSQSFRVSSRIGSSVLSISTAATSLAASARYCVMVPIPGQSQYKIILCDLCRIYNLIQNMSIDQKVLTKPFLECKLYF